MKLGEEEEHEHPVRNYTPLNEQSRKLKESSGSNEKKGDYDTPTSNNTFSRPGSTFKNVLINSISNQKKEGKKVVKNFKPSATMRPEEKKADASNVGSEVKFSQKLELNSSNVKASYLVNPIEEDEYNKSLFSSSKLSSKMTSEISQTEVLSPDNKGGSKKR